MVERDLGELAARATFLILAVADVAAVDCRTHAVPVTRAPGWIKGYRPLTRFATGSVASDVDR
jgi:hypothetical protein